MAWLTPEVARRLGDRAAAEVAAKTGLAVPPLCEYFTGTPHRHGLLLGYAAVPEDEIERGITEERSVGKECSRACRFRWSAFTSNTKRKTNQTTKKRQSTN